MKSSATSSDDMVDEGEEAGESGDVITRAKALGYLAATLEALDKASLKPDQVQRLAIFFGSMFSYDHKAGITASATALRQLVAAKNFKPQVGIRILEDVPKIKDDFRLQTPATRLEIYELFLSLIQNPTIASELQHKYGPSSGFMVDLLQLCQHERDPKNLLIWFNILRIFLAEYSTSEEVTQEIFKAFSAYFPISIRSSATPSGVTADDLKGALRQCFSAHRRLSSLTFPYLIEKLDQGDAITVNVKVSDVV
jgi:DNA repair/transcription protein MET18/MMS19